MRPELELIEKIEQYLKGELSATDKAAFEKQMANDPSLREEVRLQQEVMKGIERAHLKQKIQTAKRNFRHGKNFTKWGLGGLSVLVVLTAVFFLYKSNHTAYEGKSLPEYNETGGKQWADADKNISAQTFIIDASKDTVIETKGGIVMVVPANGFLDQNGNPANGKVELVVKEALDPATMMNAGLSTKSGGSLLESGGMFFIDARKNGKMLKINPANGIYTEVPANDIKEGMQLFTGKRMPDGTIDWVTPKPLEHDLMPVDIQTLNFYPPLYLDSLQRWGYDIRNKEFTDSLYYSFASSFSQQPEADSVAKPKPDSYEYEDRVQKDTTKKEVKLQDSRSLFISKCTSCHHVFKDATGPKLGGVLENDYYKGDIKKMARWINNVNSMIYSEPHYTELKNMFGSVMPQFTLSKQEITSIFEYIDSTYQSGVEDYYYNPITCGINPAKIKAIWNEKFQNTILSTREFEERLQRIHILKDPALLDLYVNNLDKSLYYIDSMAALICHSGDATNPFPSFAARHDGKVKNGLPQFKMLKDYYANKTRAFTEAIAKTQNEFWAKQANLDDDAGNKRNEHETDSANRVAQNFAQEFDLNLKEAYLQLGYDTSIKRWSNTSVSVYQVNVTTTGWYNVDKYVYESTLTRTTLNYTDPGTGKKAVINYKPVSFEVSQWNEYDRLYVYLLPDKLNSFMRLDGANGKYSEKLDELMQYDLVCIAYKDEQAYFYSQKSVQSKDYSGITLNTIGKDELIKELNSKVTVSKLSAILKETAFFEFEAVDKKRQKHNMALQELTDKVRKLIFLCYPEEDSMQVIANTK